MEKAGADAVQEFKASQSYIDSCADYSGTRFDDCLKQVTSAFLELDLYGITMDDPEPTTLVGDVVDESDGTPKTNPPSKADDVVVLAQLAANPPPVSASNPTIVLVDVKIILRKTTGTLLMLLLPDFAFCVFHLFCRQCLNAPLFMGPYL